MKWNVENLVNGILNGEKRAISRSITVSENRNPMIYDIVEQLYKNSGNSHIVGITGNPGSGKSTLINQMIREYQKDDKKVAMLAVDPSSPFTGGSILGDRIRIDDNLFGENLYVRSISARGSLGGLSRATFDSVMILDSAGFDVILLETVGTGQSEVEIMHLSDTTVLVMVPGLGDEVQITKSGILEIADLFVINKADMPGASSTEKDLKFMLHNRKKVDGNWHPEILLTEANRGIGISELMKAIQNHVNWLNGRSVHLLDKKWDYQLMNILKERFDTMIHEKISSEIWDKWKTKLLHKETTPYRAVDHLINEIFKGVETHG
jgi:LAO/AO transport system kinase